MGHSMHLFSYPQPNFMSWDYVCIPRLARYPYLSRCLILVCFGNDVIYRSLDFLIDIFFTKTRPSAISRVLLVISERATDRRTYRQTQRPTDKAAYIAECTRLKTCRLNTVKRCKNGRSIVVHFCKNLLLSKKRNEHQGRNPRQ